jgi:hypothetical protein
MKNKAANVVLLVLFLIFFAHNSSADMDTTATSKPNTGLDPQFQDGLDIQELKAAEIECKKKYDGLRLEICLKEAQLAYQQSKTGDRDIRGYLQEKDLVDRLYQPGLELEQLRRRYWEELRKFEAQHKIADYDNDIAYCRFDKVETSLTELSTGRISKEFPDSVTVMDAQNENGLLKPKLAKRKAELIQAEKAVAGALKEGKDSRELCAGWDVPYNLLTSDVLQKCRPHLISEMKQISELSKRAEAGFNAFKTKREGEIRNAGSCLAECRDLKPAIDRLNSLNPYPFNKCAEYMLRQELGPDLVDQVKEKLNSKIRDLHTRYEHIENLLGSTDNVIKQCDWRALETIKSRALNSMPEENCIRNYQTFSELRRLIYDLDRRKQARLNEFGYLRLRYLDKITSLERYFKSLGNKVEYDFQNTWDKNAVDHYNRERQALDVMVRDAYEKRYAACISDLIARANSFPKTISLTPRRVPEAERTIVGTWKWFNGKTVEVRPGGTCVDFPKEYDGTWSGSGRNYVLQWSKGGKVLFTDKLTLSEDGSTLTGKNQLENSVSATRVTNRTTVPGR